MLEQSAKLYTLHRPVAYRRCRRLLGDHATAEDATQETFRRAFQHLGAVTDSDHQVRWLLRVASNFCLNQLRDRRRQRDILSRLEPCVGIKMQRTTGHQVAVYMARRIPPQAREVARLIYVDEMCQNQVAETLGISRRTVVNRLAVFRASVRRALST